MRTKAGLLLAATVVVAGGATVHGDSNWVLVATPHFNVIGDDGDRKARRTAEQFETIRQVFLSALPGASHSPERLSIFAVKNEDRLRTFLPAYWEHEDSVRPAGWFRAGPFRSDIVVRTDLGWSASFVVGHEYFHAMARLNAPWLPPWLNEGLAEFWGYTQIRDEYVEVGVPIKHHLGTLDRRSFIPMEEFLDVSRGSARYNERDKSTVFYAQAWALVHYLMLAEDGANRPKFSDYMARVRRGESPVDAARISFGELDSLTARLKRYVERTRFTGATIPRPRPTSESFDVTRLSEAEGLARQSLFLSYTSSSKHSLPFAELAVENAPDSPMAQEAMGVALATAGNANDAKKWLDKAAQHDDASPAALIRAAAYLTLDDLPPSDGANAADPKERLLLRAIARNPRMTLAYEQLAYWYGRRDPDLKRAEAMARRAVAVAPESAGYRMLTARILTARGQLDSAAPIVEAARLLALRSGDANANNSVCWFGSLMGLATNVLANCELAVRLRPDWEGYIDSRGLARALSGDMPGAIADFHAFVNAERAGRDEAEVDERRRWIAALEQGESPFDDAALAGLVGDPF